MLPEFEHTCRMSVSYPVESLLDREAVHGRIGSREREREREGA